MTRTALLPEIGQSKQQIARVNGKANAFLLKPYGRSQFNCAVLTTLPEGELPI